MTVKVEKIEGGTPHNTIMWAGLLAALVCLYLGAGLNVMFNAYTFSFFGGLAAVAAIVWGSNTIKTLCSYGIGTGVPSVGMISLGSGVIAMLLATRFSWYYAPIVAVIVATIIGAIIGYMANDVIMMKIPVMRRSMTEVAIVGALMLMGLSLMATSGYSLLSLASNPGLLGILPNYGGSFIGASIIAVAFILGAIAVQHPFNATLGPSWQQDRMLMLAAECGFLTMIPLALMSIAFLSIPAVIVSLIVSVAGWLYTYGQYLCLSQRDAAAWLDAKPIREPEGH
ncbi:MAG: tetrahydromethanopterin S-methyltransferase subunit C [Methanomicrobiales archaeon]|nr:tetrahydromethanopterin S-methyltransferase subunit C [Methanomicrobiales archaeon]MDD1662199.1 tetrahydromethanopterin S-methyltransferase subunit C [Methanomicrobiales archaeon]